MIFTIASNRTIRDSLEHKVLLTPDKTFLIFEDDGKTSIFTYQQFNDQVNKVANGLLALGVKKGDKINLHLTNCPQFLFFWFGCSKIGAVIMPTNPLSPPSELSYPLQHSESILSVTQPNLLSTVLAAKENCPNIRNVILCQSIKKIEETIFFNDLVSNQSTELKSLGLSPSDDAAILYTSGTTSKPKGVLVTHANYIYLSEAISQSVRLSAKDRHLVTLPLFHANAQYYSFMTALNVGGSVALMSRFSASRFMKQAAQHQCTITSLFAAPMRMLLGQPTQETDKKSGLRLAIFAQNITPFQLEEWESRFQVPLMQIYGMTETMGQPLSNPLDAKRNNMTIGTVTLGYQCRIVDGDGKDVPRNTPGQLLVHGEPGVSIMKGYFKDPIATASTMQDGWLWTGDIVSVDALGYFTFVDRAKDMIKRAGENVAAGEVEAVLKEHQAVADAAVIGVPDPIRDESIKAFIILSKGHSASEEELILFCKSKLSKFRVPEFIEFLEDFPRTSVGKIQKHILRRRSATHP